MNNLKVAYSSVIIKCKLKQLRWLLAQSVFIFIVAFFSAHSVKAMNGSDKNNTNIQLSITPTLNNMNEVGRAKFSFLFFDIYESRLLTNTGLYQPNITPLIFEIEYLRNIKSDDLVNKTIEQWKYLNFSESKYTPYISWLSDTWPDISKGDKLALVVTNNKSAFYFNDTYLGEIKEEDFGKLFLSIWLSSSTSQPKLRKKLLNL